MYVTIILQESDIFLEKTKNNEAKYLPYEGYMVGLLTEKISSC